MDDTQGHLDRLRELRERRVALATLVATRGAAPRRDGARMFVGAGGRVLGSVTIGGCVDARVIEAAERVLAEGTPTLLSIALGDEDAWALGMTCGGAVNVRVEAVDLEQSDDAVAAAHREIAHELAAGRNVASAMLLRGPSVRLIVRADGSTAGTLGAPAADAQAAAAAGTMLGDAGSRARIESSTAGGDDIFIEVFAPPATLVIFGATHVAVPLTAMARTLGYRTIVVDGRERFATRDRFPDADEIVIGMPSEVAERMRFTNATCVVLVAHDYKYDLPVLRHALTTEVGYIGMLGSARRGRAILGFLADRGVAAEQLRRVRVPIGLDIGARSAAEIALSVLAEISATRSARPGSPMRDRETPE